MPTAEELRAQADRATAKAAEAEAKARREEEKRAQMKPQWRVADLLHTHFARTYPGAGGAMDGGDPWYYEIPSGRDAEARWLEEWERPGDEHRHFLKAADDLAERWVPSKGGGGLREDAYERVEAMLRSLLEALGPRTTAVVRERRERFTDRSVDLARDDALKAVEKLHGLASRVRT